MSRPIPHPGFNGWRSFFALIATAACIAGCGPNAGVGTGGTGSIIGFIADGYLEKATVFLDKNGNYQLDKGETSALTDAQGAFRMKVEPADIGKYPLVALAIKGVTIDRDTNQTVAGSFVLSTSKECVSETFSNVFISPISSLLREMLETGLFTNIQEAKASLIAKMDLPAETNILTDYVSANNTAMHIVARNTATLMGNQMNYVVGPGGSTVDINRYRGMMEMIVSNLSQVKEANDQNSMSILNDALTKVVSDIPSSNTGMADQISITFFKGM